MATSSGPYAPVFFPGEPLSDREAWQAAVYRGTKTLPKWPFAHRCKTFCLWQLYPSESWVWRSCSCLACRDSGGPKHSGTWTASGTGVMALSESCSWLSEGLFGQSFSIAPSVQALKGLLCLGFFSVVQHIRHIEGPLWLGSYSVALHIRHLKGHPGCGAYSVVQCVSHLMGQPLYCSAANAGVWGERGYGDGSTHYAWLSSIALLPWLPCFPPQAFPTAISSLTFPQSVSPE